MSSTRGALRWHSVTACVLATFVCAPGVSAQGAKAPKAETEGQESSAEDKPPPSAPPPDVVMTKDGGMVRGTISELDPNGEVAIQTLSGELRRFQMSDVRYAGPASGMPSPAAPEPAQPPAPKEPEPEKKPEAKGAKPIIQVNANEAPLQLVANRPNVTFHLKTGSANFQGVGQGYSYGGGPSAVAVSGTTQAYSVVCTAPCEATLPAGSHRMALSLDGGGPVEDEQAVVLNGPARVTGKYTSNQGIRTAGLVVGISGFAIGGLIMFTEPFDDNGDDLTDTTYNSLYIGAAVMLAGGLAWAVMRGIDDVAEIEVSNKQAKLRGRSVARRSTKPAAVRLTPAGLVF